MSQPCFTVRKANSPGLEGLREGVRENYSYVTLEYDEWEALKPCIDTIHRRTGQYIDYYSWAEFAGDELDVVSQEFLLMKTKLDASSNSIEVVGGYKNAVDDVFRAEYVTQVPSSHLAAIVQRSLDIISFAKTNNMVFVCKGP